VHDRLTRSRSPAHHKAAKEQTKVSSGSVEGDLLVSDKPHLCYGLIARRNLVGDCSMRLVLGALALTVFSQAATAQICPYDPRCTNNPYGAGSPYSPNSINNPYGVYGSPYSNQSVNNPYATNPPKLYDQQGNYRGQLSNNPYLPDSTSNPYGRYGSPYSPDSVNNPYGAGNPYAPPLILVPKNNDDPGS